MKLDKIKFAKVVAFVSNGFGADDIEMLDSMIDIDAEPLAQYIAAEKVNDLLLNFNKENGLIEAIKAYRVLTGVGIKEAKYTIEKYRNVKVNI